LPEQKKEEIRAYFRAYKKIWRPKRRELEQEQSRASYARNAEARRKSALERYYRNHERNKAAQLARAKARYAKKKMEAEGVA
jgi:hypothetical protein